jgi:hypothetical protein
MGTAQRGQAAAACRRCLGSGQDDQRRLISANRKVLPSPVGENLLVRGALVLAALCTRDSPAQMLRFQSSSSWPGSSTNSAGRRSEPGVRRDAWWYPLMELIADGGPMDGQHARICGGTPLAVQLGDTLKVDGRP